MKTGWRESFHSWWSWCEQSVCDVLPLKSVLPAMETWDVPEKVFSKCCDWFIKEHMTLQMCVSYNNTFICQIDCLTHFYLKLFFAFVYLVGMGMQCAQACSVHVEVWTAL